MWANKAILDEIGVSEPQTWEEFLAALDAAQAAGYVALAHGGQAWQEATIFDAVAMATGGAPSSTAGPSSISTRRRWARTPCARCSTAWASCGDTWTPNFSGRDWNLASAMVINDEAAFQLMGDWAKGEFLNAGQVPEEDFLCFRFPGTQEQVIFNTDQFAMFDQAGEVSPQQAALAEAIPGTRVPDRLQTR